MSEPAVEFDHVSYSYPGGEEAIRDVSLRIASSPPG